MTRITAWRTSDGAVWQSREGAELRTRELLVQELRVNLDNLLGLRDALTVYDVVCEVIGKRGEVIALLEEYDTDLRKLEAEEGEQGDG